MLIHSGYIYYILLAFKWPADIYAVATGFCNVVLLTNHFLGNTKEQNIKKLYINSKQLTQVSWMIQGGYLQTLQYRSPDNWNHHFQTILHPFHLFLCLSQNGANHMQLTFFLCVRWKIISKSNKHTQSEEISFTSASLGRFRKEFVFTHSMAFSPT
jgi:hypothetical protein